MSSTASFNLEIHIFVIISVIIFVISLHYRINFIVELSFNLGKTYHLHNEKQNKKNILQSEKQSLHSIEDKTKYIYVFRFFLDVYVIWFFCR